MKDTTTINTVEDFRHLDKPFDNGCGILSNEQRGAHSRRVAGHGCRSNGGTPINSKHPHNLFPYKLRRLLEDAATENNEHIISWLPDGRSFKVHDPVTFTNKLLGRYFSQKCFSSFTRQLYHYGFSKIDADGNFKTSFYHPKFQRDNILSYLTMDRRNARAHRLVPTTPLQCNGKDNHDHDDSIPYRAMRGRPPRKPREPCKNPLPSCLFFVDEESCTKDHEHDERQSDDSVWCESLHHQSSSTDVPPPSAATTATTFDTLVGASIITRSRSSSSSSNSIQEDATPAVSCPMSSCTVENPSCAQSHQHDHMESSFLLDAPSPGLDDQAWAMTLMAINHLNQHDEQEQQEHHQYWVENDEMTARQSPKTSRNDGTRDWLTILETLPWSCDKDLSSNDWNDISRSETLLEPRSLQYMVRDPLRIEEFLSWQGSPNSIQQE